MAQAREGAVRSLSTWARFLIAFGVGAVAAALVPSIHIYLRLLLAWIGGALCFMASLWPVFRTGDPTRAARSEGLLAKETK